MKHILIVDDDVHIGNLLETALTQEGYRVSRAYSGTEALLVLSASRPDLVLLDLMLPKIDGLEACRRIRETNDKLYAIGEGVGYHDPVQFNRAFREEMNCSPREYKKASGAR